MADITPWLETGPRDHLAAVEAGAHVGLQQAALQQAAQHEAAQAQAQQQQFAAQMAAQQATQVAAQRFQQQQMARQQQQDAQSQAQWEAEYGMQATAAAKKYQALQEYKSRIAGGEDPLKVMMELGPAAGVPGAAQAMGFKSMLPSTKKAVTAPQVAYADIGGRKVPYLIDTVTGRATWAPSGAMGGKEGSPLTTYQRFNMSRQYRKDIGTLLELHPELNTTEADPAWSPKTLALWKSGRSRLADLSAQIKALESGQSGGAGGGGRVKVKYKGQTGTIPAEQVPDVQDNPDYEIIGDTQEEQ